MSDSQNYVLFQFNEMMTAELLKQNINGQRNIFSAVTLVGCLYMRQTLSVHKLTSRIKGNVGIQLQLLASSSSSPSRLRYTAVLR